MTCGSGGAPDGPLDRLVEWAMGADVLLEEDVAHAVTVVTDTVAAIVGASVEAEVAGLAHVAPPLGGPGRSTVLATGRRTRAMAAALANGQAAVRLELDEGNQFAANHPSAHTFPALLAVAEDLDADGQAFLAACAAAYEVAVRVGSAVRLRRAVHPFPTAMVCGAAVGVARLRGLDRPTTLQAVLIAAALTPASTQRAANTGATVRNALSGVGASSAVLAVELALTGTTGDPEALHTVFGQVLGETFDETALDRDLGTRRFLTRNYFKLHACSRWNHAPIEATATLIAQHGVRHQDVAAIEVATYDPATRLDGRDAATGFAGKHSIPYSVAARLIHGDNGVDAYSDEAADDRTLRDLMSRVAVVEDPALTRLAPQVRAARVTLQMRDGTTLSAGEDRPPGGFDRPYGRETLRVKHRSLLGRALTRDGVEKALAWCVGLPEAGSVRGLHEVVAGRL